MEEKKKKELLMLHELDKGKDDSKTIEMINSFGVSSPLKGVNVLFWSVVSRRTSIVKYLIKENADVNVKDHDNFTPLMQAIDDKDYELTKILLEAGANPKIRHTKGADAMFKAIRIWSLPIIKLLVEYGSNPFEKNKGKYSNYDEAVSMGVDEKIIEYFNEIKQNFEE